MPSNSPSESQRSLEQGAEFTLGSRRFRASGFFNSSVVYTCLSPQVGLWQSVLFCEPHPCICIQAIPDTLCQLPGITLPPTLPSASSPSSRSAPRQNTSPTTVGNRNFELETTTTTGLSAAASINTGSSSNVMVVAAVASGAVCFLIITTITVVKCRQRRRKLQRVEARVAQPALHAYDTPVQRLSQSGLGVGLGGMARGSGPAEDYRGYLQPSRSGGRQPTTGYVSNAVFVSRLEETSA